jgi:DNA polymerase III subunit beta
MQFTINKNKIVNVLSKIQTITNRKSNLAITECVLIQTLQNAIKLIATDLETGFEGEYEALVESPGVVAINARKFYEILREFPDDSVHIREVDNRWIEIGNHNVQFHIVGLNAEDFPHFPFIEDIHFIEVESLPLRKMIERTVLITGAPDDKRPHVNGICVEFHAADQGNLLRLVSTDISRLSCVNYRLSPDTVLSVPENILIPKKGLIEVAKFLSSEGIVRFGLTDNYLIVKHQLETVVTRLLEGDFPKYDVILQKDEHIAVTVDKHLFIKMLKRMSILSSESYKAAMFKFSSDRLLITATNPELGESKEDMPITFDGDAIEAAFNPKFFIETLNVIDEDEVLVYIYNKDRPCIVEGMIDKHYLSVIMPMKI